jgi:predicted component of type VI protein secretion system
MAEESLRELLARLHEQLGVRGSGSLDVESRQLLATAMRDIERALDRADRGMDKADQTLDDASAAVAAHTPRLESLAVRFEAGHPGIAEALRELIDALVKAGI